MTRTRVPSICRSQSFLWIILLAASATPAAARLALPSTDGSLVAVVAVNEQGRMTLALSRNGTPIIQPSALGITVDGHDLGTEITLGEPTSRTVRQQYPWRGVKSEALNHCNAYQVPVEHADSGQRWTLEVRVFNDGAGYRYLVPGSGPRRVEREASSWKLPRDSTLWYQTDTNNYEGVYEHNRLENIPRETKVGDASTPTYLGPPVTAELPQGGYLLISEAGLRNYSGMTLRPTGSRVLQAAFQDDPNGWLLEGEIVTPWRVAVVTTSLDELVNSVVIPNLCEPHDPNLFPQGVNTEWIKPGKGPITWAVFGNDGAQWHRQKWFVDRCVEMNCEYLLVDAGWRTEKWGWKKDGGDVWKRLAELCEYAAQRDVGIFVWHAYPEGRDDGPGLTDPEARDTLLRKCREAGVKGVKIDFFDSERKEIVDVCEEILRTAAEHQLMVNFHGANKPTGEVRTWPNEITREGIREQEYVLWDELPLSHYAALPFTRMVAGHADFLPGYVRPQYLRNTTAVFQMATAVVFTSPFICWPDHPDAYLETPFLSLIRDLPPVWDETCVLDGSAIGKFVALARLNGADWYVAVLNCQDSATTYQLGLEFLADGDYSASLYQDREGPATAAQVSWGTLARKGQVLAVQLKAGGGFVGRFSKQSKYTQ